MPLNQNINMAIALPGTNEPEILISRDQYLISYNPNRRSPNWVAWKLQDRDIGSIKRSNNFRKDPDLEQYLSRTREGRAVDFNEFSGSCFDRGHQIPSKDRTDIAHNNDETFVMSNMIPQTPYLNQIIWEHFESYTRTLAQQQHKRIYVIAGPIYDSNFGKIGPDHDIPVPSKDFKILIILDANQTPADINSKTPVLAIIMPNLLEDGSRPIPGTKGCIGFKPKNHGRPDDWMQYQTTISEVEKVSGLSFGHFNSSVLPEVGS